MYYTVIKHDGHLITQRKCRKHEPQASVFYISLLFADCVKIAIIKNRNVLPRCSNLAAVDSSHLKAGLIFLYS